MFESIWTNKEPDYNLPALEAIQGDFSILLDISRLPILSMKH